MKSIPTIVIYMHMFKQMDNMTFYRHMQLHVPVIFHETINKMRLLALK